MVILKTELKLAELLENALTGLDLNSDKFSVQDCLFNRPKLAINGDWSSPIAFELWRRRDAFPTLENFSDPADLARHVQAEVVRILGLDSDSFISKVETKGPFINFFLTDVYLSKEVDELMQISNWRSDFLVENGFLNREFLVEFSSPNIAKPFTIGHLRSTIIGEAVANLLREMDAKVYRDNHLGDWGTQFGKQILAIKSWGNIGQIESSEQPVKELVSLYVKFHEEAEKSPELNDEARAWFKRLEDGDGEAKKLWQFCIDVSMKEFQRIYDLLGVEFTENDGKGYGESYFSDKMTSVIEELREKGLLKKSEGAELVFFDESTKLPPLMILRKDGATLYATRDLATDKDRFERYGNDLTIINEVGSEQSLYFEQLFEVEKKLGWIESSDQRKHLKHGMYRFKDRKMSTRKGDVVWLDDVLREAFERVQVMAKADDLNEEQIWKIALGALKWNDLSKESARDIDFDLDQILNLKGNSGPYMQYTFVRALSILQKGNELERQEIEEVLAESRARLNNGWDDGECQLIERELMVKIGQFPEEVAQATEQLATQILANYLFELATVFNSFYAQLEIKGNFNREKLTLVTAEIIKKGLAILGIEVVDRM